MAKKIHVPLDRIAEECGVVVFAVEADEAERWGGNFGYKYRWSNSSFMGYKTRKDALRGWFEREFDSELGKVLLRDYLTV